MTITNKGIKAGGRSARVDRSGIRTATDTYQLVATNGETPYQVASDSSLPRLGSSYPDDPLSWCVDISVSLTEGKTGYEVTCSYSSEVPVYENPLDEPARISWDGENFQQVAIVDKDDNPIVNSAGDPYDPPLMKDFSRPVATIKKNVSGVPTWILNYQDAINSDAFTIEGMSVAVGKAKVKRVSISEQSRSRNNIDYRELTLVIHFAKDGWTRKVLDAGFRRKFNGTKRENIVITAEDGYQQAPPAPVPLDGSGEVLADPTPTTCVYNKHDLDESLPFSALPLS